MMRRFKVLLITEKFFEIWADSWDIDATSERLLFKCGGDYTAVIAGGMWTWLKEMTPDETPPEKESDSDESA